MYYYCFILAKTFFYRRQIVFKINNNRFFIKKFSDKNQNYFIPNVFKHIIIYFNSINHVLDLYN